MSLNVEPTPVPERPPERTPNRTNRVSTARSLARLIPYARSAMPRLALGMVAALLAGLVALAIPQVLGWLVDGALATGDRSQVWTATLIVLGLGVSEAIFIALRRWLVLTPGTQVEAKLRNTLYAKLQDLPVSFHDRWPSGQLLSRSMSDLGLIRRWLAFGLVLLIVNGITIVVGFAILITENWLLGLIFFACSVPLWIYSAAFEIRYSTIARRSQDQNGDLATAVEESVHGIRVLKAFGRGRHALKDFEAQAEELRGTELAKAKAIATIWFWLLLVPDLAFAGCLVLGVWLVSQGQISVGELVAFFATAAVLRFPIESIGFLLTVTFDTRTAVDRIFEVIESDNTIQDPEEPTQIENPRGELVFDSVHFRHQDAPATSPDLLNGINLSVRPGETMALVGLTGSGKSTITALTTRLYDVTEGSIRLDGIDIRELSRNELRRHIAMAFEDATLFSASVRENVRLGRETLDPLSTEADAVLAQALDIAQAGFVKALPDGSETLIGEEGLSLSGGQRQRLALARAIASAPAVLVLDDPLSALDVDTEARVEAGLRRALTSTTALIVAHRPSTVALADRVALLEDGRITAVGTHSELLATNPHYAFVISSLDDSGAAESDGAHSQPTDSRQVNSQQAEETR